MRVGGHEQKLFYELHGKWNEFGSYHLPSGWYSFKWIIQLHKRVHHRMMMMGYRGIVNWPLFIGVIRCWKLWCTIVVRWLALQKCTIEMGGLI